MARYTGPKVRISRRFNEPIMGENKSLQKKSYPPGQHGRGRKRKQSEYAIQLAEKQKAKYIYGLLERQFAKMFVNATRKKGVTGEILLQMLECRLDNLVYRFGIAPTRRAGRATGPHRSPEAVVWELSASASTLPANFRPCLPRTAPRLPGRRLSTPLRPAC